MCVADWQVWCISRLRNGLTGFYLPLLHYNSNGWKLIGMLYMLPVHPLFVLLSEEALS